MPSDWTVLILIFYIIHGAIMALTYLLVKRKVSENDRGILVWWVMVSMLVPVIGELFGLLAWWIANKVGTNGMMDDYQDYVKFKPLNLEHIRYETLTSNDLLPLSEAFSDQGNGQRKDLLIRLIHSDITNKGRYLNMGLSHSDSETVHYAATTMNLLLDRYEKEVELAKQGYDPNEPESILKLIRAFETYLQSGLLQGTSQQRLEREYIAFLEQEKARGLEFLQLDVSLGEVYFQHGQTEKAVVTMERVVEQYPMEPDGYLWLIEYYYGINDWASIPQLLDSLEEFVADEKIPEKRRFIIKQMGGVGY